DGPHTENLSDETFEMIVETTRGIIDAVKPSRTFYALETMPWIFPHTADAYLRLIKAVDRKSFAAHFDPVNMVASPEIYYDTARLIRECFAKFGRYVRSCHAKDVSLAETLTVHITETRPGLGALDYRTYLSELNRLDPDVPLMLEHLHDADEYARAAAYVRSVADKLNIAL
ncbi:MAG TPA: sugar phosphate isomerase/epimerase, partial [Planctomycetes bacterium]|nr:sugar phosphate isomerase/epimerase [Planctomycetota bacterium]